MRTIIDILKRGNSELFHSAMIAWLLDPEAEHGLGRYIIEAFANLIGSKGNRVLQDTLYETKIQVKTEVGIGNCRYDILLEVGEYKLVLENKVKSVGNEVQIECYRKELNADVIGLGFHQASFSEEAREKNIIITYSDFMNILNVLPFRTENNPYLILIDQYRSFLKRELQIIEGIKQANFDGNQKQPSELAEQISAVKDYTDNDIRYLNLIYL